MNEAEHNQLVDEISPLIGEGNVIAPIIELIDSRCRIAAKLAVADYITPRPIEEYHEDMGNVLWWRIEDGKLLGEPPYVGTPGDMGKEVLIHVEVKTIAVDGDINAYTETVAPYDGSQHQRVNVGGWPGYHTHFTPIPLPQVPK